MVAVRLKETMRMLMLINPAPTQSSCKAVAQLAEETQISRKKQLKTHPSNDVIFQTPGRGSQCQHIKPFI